MFEEITKVVKQQVNLMGLMEEVREVRATINQRYKRIELLEQRIVNLEQYFHPYDLALIISGYIIFIKQYSNTRSAASDRQGEVVPSNYLHSLEQQVFQFLSSENIHIEKITNFILSHFPTKGWKNQAWDCWPVCKLKA